LYPHPLLLIQGKFSDAFSLEIVGRNISIDKICPCFSLSNTRDIKFTCLWELNIKDMKDPYHTFLYMGEDWEIEGYKLALVVGCELYLYQKTNNGLGFLKYPGGEFYSLNKICQKLSCAGEAYVVYSILSLGDITNGSL